MSFEYQYEFSTVSCLRVAFVNRTSNRILITLHWKGHGADTAFITNTSCQDFLFSPFRSCLPLVLGRTLTVMNYLQSRLVAEDSGLSVFPVPTQTCGVVQPAAPAHAPLVQKGEQRRGRGETNRERGACSGS